ncbi:phosphoethanolamine transferase CptA [Algibacter agarivorans]|uniref:Phosphoethanolamine transferase CptA n=1 Tax=Algibacter agarivorans TaxID=1109741 RepID=A0ABP9GQS7_9FLAO
MFKLKGKIYLLVFIYWLILEYVLEGVFHFFSFYRFYNIVENLLFTAFVIFIISQINNNTIKRNLYGLFIIFVACMFWFETIMYLNFKIHFGPSSFFVFLNTNPDELTEFVKEYSNTRLVIVTILFLMPLLKLKSIVNCVFDFGSKYQLKRKKILKTGIIAILFLTVFKFSLIVVHNLPYLICRSLILNYKDTQYIDDFNAKIDANSVLFQNINSSLNSTFIVVIGESVTSAHMQLYGYYRETTPFFYNNRDSLSIYKDVISPNTSTFHSLSKALTLGNYEDPKKVLALPITTLFNKSGFKTFWISNHSPAFNPGSNLARVANQAQSIFFNSKEAVMNNLKHDGELLYKIDEALKDKAPNKIIFLHLIGAHFSYENRYPNEFNVFKDKPQTQFNSEMAHQKINTYDNAVKYSDFILDSVLDKIKRESTINKYLLYFSDHGEEVFQDDNFYGHLEDRPTKNTFKIPFVMWYGNQFAYPNDYVFDENRKYMTDDLWHSIAHISGLKNLFVDSTRSVFSNNFIKRKRIILESKDYETLFK